MVLSLQNGIPLGEGGKHTNILNNLLTEQGTANTVLKLLLYN